jgi:protoporphyrinogen oxidase
MGRARIRDFSFKHALLSVLGLQRKQITTLIEKFRYPRLGPGQMWEKLAADVEARGFPVHLNQRCVASSSPWIRHRPTR